MKIEKKSGKEERLIVTGMLVDPHVLGRIAAKWPAGAGGLFQNKYANLLAHWAVKHWERYGTPPGSAVAGYFANWAEKRGSSDKDTVALVEKFLASLSDEYEQAAKECNAQYTLDLADKHFNKVALANLATAVQGHLDNGEVELAHGLASTYNHIELAGGAGIDVFQDEAAIRQAFEANAEPLIIYPDSLGQFFRWSLQRGGFVSFLGPEKRGKSWWLLDIVVRAIVQRRRVAYFEVGDQSQEEVIQRIGCRVARQPLEWGQKWPYTVKVPTAIERDPDSPLAEVAYDERTYESPLTWRTAWAAVQSMMENKVKSKNSYLKLSCHPNSSISVAGIKSIVQGWVRTGWVPDVIVIDYADILAPPAGTQETRDQINATWKALRALSQSLHCLVVTATQADAASYDQDTLDMKNFSEDKRKFAHVTGMVGINQNAKEKEHGIMRLNWLVLRKGKFNKNRLCHVAGCLELGNPAVKSTF